MAARDEPAIAMRDQCDLTATHVVLTFFVYQNTPADRNACSQNRF